MRKEVRYTDLTIAQGVRSGLRMREIITLAMLGSITLFTSATAAETVAIGELSKSGYSCKEVGEARHQCTRDKSPTYGCEQLECKVIPRRTGGNLQETIRPGSRK
jgi:hypothetical protein